MKTKRTLGTSYNPPVKYKLLSLKFQHDKRQPFFKAHVALASCSDVTFFSTIFSRKANLLSKRYIYPACLGRQASLIQILKFYERPCIVPHEVFHLNVVSRALYVEILKKAKGSNLTCHQKCKQMGFDSVTS